MQDFENTFSDAETFAKILGFAFIGAIVISMPYLVIVMALALSAIAFVAMFASYVTFEQSFDVATIKANAEFVAHVARVQARQHSSKTKFAMQRAKKQRLVIANIQHVPQFA